jgi:hypothetical protein
LWQAFLTFWMSKSLWLLLGKTLVAMTQVITGPFFCSFTGWFFHFSSFAYALLDYVGFILVTLKKSQNAKSEIEPPQ